MDKERIIVICPGRGTYTRETSGYLKKYGKSALKYIEYMDNKRKLSGLQTLTELDESSFKAKTHLVGEHASNLIYACSLSDFLSIDQNKYEIVAVTGNSMGWYIALALVGAITPENAYLLIHTMGSMMKDGVIGGQIIYPVVDEKWQVDDMKKEMVLSEAASAGCFVSIFLGGYIVIGGNQESLDLLLKQLPFVDKYPFQLPYHAAFHTQLMDGIPEKAMSELPSTLFQKPIIPLVDGRGCIWYPHSTDVNSIWNYTLNHQVVKSYDFTKAITVSIKEFCPDKLVLLGPGNSLGGVIGQILIKNKWLDLDSKSAFSKYQKNNPFLISMGLEEQRNLISK